MQLIDGIPVFGPSVDEGALHQIKQCAIEADHVALMADHHKGYNMPIGGVAAYSDHVSPAGVGFDIACGNKAVKLNVGWLDVGKALPLIADDIFSKLSFGVGRNNNEVVDHELFDDPAWTDIPFLSMPGLKDMARNQLGTIGSGNHYVDVFYDSKSHNLWVGCHFGSRGLGHKIATYFIEQTGAKANGNMDDPPRLIQANTSLGEDYVKAMELAGKYAYAGRDWVCQRVAQILGADIIDEVHNHHNYAWRENHGGKDMWVVRKGATPARPGQRGFVGGSMGHYSVILEGIESEEGQHTLYSTVHGAGRVMSRTEAAGKKRWVKDESGKRRQIQISQGKVDMQQVYENLTTMGVILRGGGADEAPQVYKQLSDVLECHEKSIKVTNVLFPVIVCMAGSNEYDPYKD